MISVCMATYNGGKYLKAQIGSILMQLSDEDEIIISDDGSTDDTFEILYSFADHRIKIFQHIEEKQHRFSKNHYNVTSNFENALNHAKGDVIFLSDQDDIWLPYKVQVMMQYLKVSDIVISNCALINSAGDKYAEKYVANNFTYNSLWYLIKEMPFMGCCMAFRKSVLAYSLPFPQNCIMHDNWIGIMGALKKQNIFFIDESLILYRRFDGNVSSFKGHSNNPLWYKLSYRLQMLQQLFLRFYFNK